MIIKTKYLVEIIKNPDENNGTHEVFIEIEHESSKHDSFVEELN